MDELEGVWRVERVSGFLPPLLGVRKHIHAEHGRTTLGPARASFEVVGRELHYVGLFAGFVDVLEPADAGWAGRALYRGREYGRFRLIVERDSVSGARE